MAFVEDRPLCKHGDGVVRRVNKVNDTKEDVPRSNHLSDCRVRPVVKAGRTNKSEQVNQTEVANQKGMERTIREKQPIEG